MARRIQPQSFNNIVGYSYHHFPKHTSSGLEAITSPSFLLAVDYPGSETITLEWGEDASSEYLHVQKRSGSPTPRLKYASGS